MKKKSFPYTLTKPLTLETEPFKNHGNFSFKYFEGYRMTTENCHVSYFFNIQ